jgi:UDP-N-acetylmuramate: L-alanyl-gamma-D-glutamyl-meso-diaminopimelate ligase
MKVHILGICGTFMGGIAALAKELGHEVTGSDQNVYPPMSDQLEALGVTLIQGFNPKQLEDIKPDCVIVGNALSRGNPCVEWLLDKGIPLISGPQWLKEHVLQGRWVVAVAGTHGKTTTSSMLAWILSQAGMNPGFLIGGVSPQLEVSARLGQGPFVIEADEYDTAFFDKRSKFIHYWPKTCVMNNLEFDHADIFQNLAEIQKQFQHLVRLIPSTGLIIHPSQDEALQQVLAKGCWCPIETVLGPQANWQAKLLKEDGSAFKVIYQGQEIAEIVWQLIGPHNVANALSAFAAATHVGLSPEQIAQALHGFQAPKRRLEVLYQDSVTLYDDFAHHPTAIQSTLSGLRAKVGKNPIGVLLDLRSNTMKLGTHEHHLYQSLDLADYVGIYQSPEVKWNVKALEKRPGIRVFQEVEALTRWFDSNASKATDWVIMSNGSFQGLNQKLVQILREREKDVQFTS